MISVIRRVRFRVRTAAVASAVAVGASLTVAAPAQAYDIPAFEIPEAAQAPVPYVERAADSDGVVQLWRTGGPATSAAAAKALVGGSGTVQVFLDSGQDAALAADRRQLVTELTTRGSAHVRAAAKEALASAGETEIFLSRTWRETWKGDLRTAATFFLDYGNPRVRQAASGSLDKGDAAVEQFVLGGWRTIAEGEDRVAVTFLTNSAIGGVSLGAQAALDSHATDATAAFLRYGQFVATAREANTRAVTALLRQVKADVAAHPVGSREVAERASAAVEQARSTTAAANKADADLLHAEWNYLTKQAVPRNIADSASMAAGKPYKAAFAKAAEELPGLSAAVSARGADLDSLILEARQATLDLALTGTPEVKKAAEAALADGDAAVKAFITEGHAAAIGRDSLKPSAFVADRQRVYQLLALGGGHVNKAADAALGSGSHADVRYFLEYGFADAQELDNRILAYRSLNQAGPQLRAAANVALDGDRAGLQAFATLGQFSAVERDKATAAHVATIDAMISELAGLADQAKVDAGKAADAAQAAQPADAQPADAREAASAVGAAGASALPGQPNSSSRQGAGVGPIVIPWPREPAPAAGRTEAVPGPAVTGPGPSIFTPSVAAKPQGAASLDAAAPEAAGPVTGASADVSGWTMGPIVALVLVAAGAVTVVLRRRGQVQGRQLR